MGKIKLIVSSLILFLLLCLDCTDGHSQDYNKLLFKCTTRLEEPYGICTHVNSKEKTGDWYQRIRILKDIRKIGINYMRTDFYWYSLQPRIAKPLNFKQYDDFIRPMNKEDIKFLPIFTYQQSLTNNALNQPDKWINYILSCINRYPKIKYVEIINEADRISGLNGSDYSKLLQRAYKAIKKFDKDIMVLYSSYSKSDSNFFDEVMITGSDKFFDIMNFHFYNWNYPPETASKQFLSLKQKLDEYHINKPVWVTETGYPTTLVSEENQAKYLPRVFIIGFSYGFDKMFWYDFKSTEIDAKDNESHFGIYHSNLSPKPASLSYQILIKMCPSGSTRPVFIKDNNLYVAHWELPSKKNVFAVWSSNDNYEISINENKYKAYLYNGRLMKTTNTLNVGNSLIYIKGLKNSIKINNKIYKF